MVDSCFSLQNCFVLFFGLNGGLHHNVVSRSVSFVVGFRRFKLEFVVVSTLTQCLLVWCCSKVE